MIKKPISAIKNIFEFFLLYFKSELFKQIPIHKITKSKGIFTLLSAEECIEIPLMPYWGECNFELIKRRVVPLQWQACIYNATVYAPSFAITSGKILWQIEESTELPYFSAGYSKYFQQVSMKYRLTEKHEALASVKEAALISHRTSFNYFHAVAEAAPKIIALKEFDPECRIPAILDARMVPSVREALVTLIGPHREIINMQSLNAILVKKLHVFSTPSHLPDDAQFNPVRACVSPTKMNIISQSYEPDWASPAQSLIWVSKNSICQRAVTAWL